MLKCHRQLCFIFTNIQKVLYSFILDFIIVYNNYQELTLRSAFPSSRTSNSSVHFIA